MDNQQGKTKLIWLTGFMDGEGYLSVIPQRRKGYDKTYYTPVIKIAGTCFKTIEVVAAIFKTHNIGHHIEFRRGKGNQRDSKSIVISGWKRVQNFTDLMADMPWVTKEQEFKTLKLLVDTRLSHNYKDDYTDLEIELAESLRGKRLT